MGYAPNKHGRAEYGSWMQLPNSQSIDGAISEGDESLDIRQQKFAQLVYVVNSSDGGGSTVDLTPIATALSNQTSTLMTALNEMIIDSTYSRIMQTIGTDTYIAHAPRGTSPTAAGWRIQKITESGSRMWAGNGGFGYSTADVVNLPWSY
jgi:hypothetical protein